MALAVHVYNLDLEWTGNLGVGTAEYHVYDRSYTIRKDGKEPIEGSSDVVFRGDGAKYNPEELLLAAVASCHMLWFLHICADKGIRVISYQDNPVAEMRLKPDESGKIDYIELHPKVVLEATKNYSKEVLIALHHKAHEMCFIANTLNCSFNILPKFEQDIVSEE